MKKIFLLTTMMLVWSGSVVAGELKVAVPVDEFKQIKSRLEALEKENSQLKKGSGPDGSIMGSPGSPEMEGRLQATENENSRLRQELNALKSQERSTSSNMEIQAKLDTVEKENRQLKEAQARQSEKSPVLEDASLATKLNVVENENSKLQQEIKALKDGGFAAVFAENKISARELYFLERKKGINHAFKF